MFGKTVTWHQFGFAPDLPTSTPGVWADMDFMYPTLSGARTLPSLVAGSNALPLPATEVFLSVRKNGGLAIFAGTAEHLYQLQRDVVTLGKGMTYDQFTQLYKKYGSIPLGLPYNSPSFGPPGPTVTPGFAWVEVDGTRTFVSGEWSFGQNGDDTIVTNGVDPVMVFPAAGSQFSPLGGSPPVAKFVVAVDPGAGVSVVTILANLASDPTGWVASAPGNDALWSLNVNDLSASGFLRSQAGPITGAKDVRTLAVLFKRNAIYVGQFVGPPYVWNFYPVSHEVGCLSNDAIIDVGDLLAFPGPDDFYTFDGYTLNPIPNALRQWFFGEQGPTQGGGGIADPNFLNTIKARYDEVTGVVFWHFASVMANPAGTLDTYVCWNKKSGRWGVGHLAVEAVLARYATPGMTYDEFTARTRYGTYSQLPHLTYGDKFFGPAATRAQAVIGIDGILYSYTGLPNSGYLQTGDLGDPIRLSRVNRLRGQFGVFPARSGTGQRALMSSFVRRNLGDTLTPFKSAVPLSDQGYWDFMESSGWHQFKFQFQSDAEIQALTPDVQDAGDR